MTETAIGAGFGDDDEPPERTTAEGWPGDDWRELPIEDLNLSMRAYNCLRRGGIKTIGDIMERSPDDLLAIRNLGMKSLLEIWARLHELLSPPGEA